MVPFIDLKAQYLTLEDEIKQAVHGVLESTQYVLGKEVKRFEEEFAAYSGAAHGIALNSGTSALHLALLAAGVGPGDEVITVPFTFVATVAAIEYAGATPIFVDVDPQSYTMDVDQLEAAITQRTKAVMPVHLYGQMADMDPIMEIADRHNLIVIEDAAQAHGAEYKGRRAGSIGAMGCFSFYAGKNLGACGEGGMVVTNNPAFDRSIRMLRDWGQDGKYNHVMKGYNYRMDGLQGAILRVKLRHLDTWTEARRARARYYNEILKETDLVLPREMPERRHVYHLYAIQVDDRKSIQQALQDREVHSGIHYPTPVHLLPAYDNLGYSAGDFPVSEHIAKRELSLPIFAELTEEQQQQVAEVLNRAPAY